MEFGIFSNGFRPHTSASRTYDEDLQEIVLADQLGFRDCYISEHHGEAVHYGQVDTLPAPELLMCKAAALTKRIRMGAAVKVIHLHHPLDVAVQAAVTDHLIGDGRFIFGFGTGFPAPPFSMARGLPFEERHARLAESLDFILKCWSSDGPFDWDGKYWKGKNIVALPHPLNRPHMPMATATETDAMLKLSAERGYTLLSAFMEPPAMLRAKAGKYARYAAATGNPAGLRNVTASRLVYIAGSRSEAIEDMREAVAYETNVQAQRGFLKVIKGMFGVELTPDGRAIEQLVDAGIYIVGDVDTVTEKLKSFYDAAGGFGTLLIATGKDWSTRDKRAQSMRLFMEQVAPRLRHLDPADRRAA